MKWGGALETATRQYFDFVDRKDAEAIIRAGTEDIQAVDEISRRWMRGIDELGADIRHVVNMVEDVHTSISNVKETLLGDIGILTCWIEQDYTLEGKPNMSPRLRRWCFGEKGTHGRSASSTHCRCRLRKSDRCSVVGTERKLFPQSCGGPRWTRTTYLRASALSAVPSRVGG